MRAWGTPQRVATVCALCGLFAIDAAHAQVAPRADRPKLDHSSPDPELLQDLIDWAVRLSGRDRPAPGAAPTLQALPDAALAQAVCPLAPQGCRGIVAAYDTDRRHIVYRASLEMHEPTDQSFIVHELVHWLQHLQTAGDFEGSCESVLAAEHEAYDVQNRYLARFKQWQRVGDVLRFTFCPAGASSAGEPKLLFDAGRGR